MGAEAIYLLETGTSKWKGKIGTIIYRCSDKSF
jgi:hypothetical protein